MLTAGRSSAGNDPLHSPAEEPDCEAERLLGPEECDPDEEGPLCEAGSLEGRFEVPLSELDPAVGNRKLVAEYAYRIRNRR